LINRPDRVQALRRSRTAAALPAEDTSFFYLPSPTTSLGYGNPNHPDLWLDLDGAVEIEMISGSVILTAVAPQKAVPGAVYWTKFDVVPEPSAMALLVLGSGLALWAAIEPAKGQD